MGDPAARISLLGPVTLTVDDEDVRLGGVLARAMLALLTLEAGRAVSVDSLVDALWGDDLPSDPRASLQSHASRLRRAVGADALTGLPGGYRLDVRPDQVDALAVRRAAARVRDQVTSAPEAAAEVATRLLRGWRGLALSDVRHLPGLGTAAAGLDDLRLVLVEDRARALIALGRGEEAAAELAGEADVHPLRERTHALLVRALHTDGRTVDALAVADDFRRRLADETGLDPGAELAAARDEALRAAPPSSGRGGGGRGAHAPATRRASGMSVRLGAFVGRETETADLRRAVTQPGVVTVMGPGGVGKTRLVDEFLATRDTDGEADPPSVTTVELADIKDPADVVPAVGSALRLGGQLTARAVVEYLGVGRSLLVLDNCEHVLEGVRPLVRHLLGGAPGVTVLATSRVRLGLPGEQVVRLAPLRSGHGAADDVSAPAVDMLLDRYRRAGGSESHGEEIAAARAIAARLDGLPLAIELAAARAATLGLIALRDRLADDLTLLDAALDTPERHAGLDALVSWSLQLLDPASREAFEVLSVFEGGFTLDAGDALVTHVLGVRGAGPIAALADASLVVRDTGAAGSTGTAETRLRIPEPMRERARHAIGDRLPDARNAHLRWMIARLEGLGPDADGGGIEPLRVAVTERANTRAAVRTALELEEADLASRLAAAAGRVFLTLVRLDPEAIEWIRGLVAVAGVEATPTAVAALGSAAVGAVTQGEEAVGRDLADRALALADGGADPTGRHMAWQAHGLRLLYQGNTECRDWWHRVAADGGLAPYTRQGALQSLALSHVNTGDVARARHYLEQARILQNAAPTLRTTAWSDYIEGEVLRAEGQSAAAMTVLRQSITLAEEISDDFVAGVASVSLVSVLARAGRTREAAARFPRMLDFWRRGGAWPQQWTTLRIAAEVLVDADDPATALLLVEAADRAPDSPGVTGPDVTRLAAVRDRATRAMGPTEARRTIATAAVLPRARVLERALQAVTAVGSGAPAV